MSLNNFIRSIWEAKIMQAKDSANVFAKVANREWEGEIKKGGGEVRINQIGAITVAAYTKDTTTLSRQNLVDAQTIIPIDQWNYFDFEIDDVDKAQGNPAVMGEAMRKAAFALAATQDAYIAGLYAQAGLGVSSASSTVCPFTSANPLDMTSLNVVEAFRNAREYFEGYSNVDTNKLFAIIPPWVHTKLWLAGVANKTANDAMYASGQIENSIGFKFYLSNNVSNSGSWACTKIMIGIEGESLAVAEQLMETEAYRPEGSFSDAVKGLHGYGAKWYNPNLTMCMYADYTAEA